MAKGRGTRSFLERNQRLIGGVGLGLVLVGTVLALLLQGGLLTPSYTVTAYFSDAAGIRSGDNVTVAGLPAGRVEDVRIEKDRVAIDLGVEDAVALPADTRAEIVIETLLGRRAVGLVAGHSDKPLEEGAEIPLERTTTPVDITELNDISVRLLEASDADAFEQFLSDLTEATEGREQELRTLITGLNRVTAAVDSRREELAGLIESLRTLSTTLGERDQTVVSLIDNLNVVLGNLAQRQRELETLLVSTASGSQETADLVRRNRGILDSALTYLHTDLQVLNRHQLDLAAGIAYLNQAVEGYSSVGYSQGTPNKWANIFVQSLGPLGVDQLIGQCGAVDQFFDHYFGTDCHDAGRSGSPVVRTAPPGTQAGTSPGGDSPAGQLPPQVESLPCTITDVVGSALAGTSAAPLQRCET
jgi:phospholipid/cholesterol/gamma-HCH transport system substrate-binding protein